MIGSKTVLTSFIKTFLFREWSGSSDMYQNEFQFDSEEKKLPTVHLSCGKRLHINLCTIRRRVIHSLLAQLTSPPTHKKKLTNDELASISLDSGFLSDSKDDLDSNDVIFSPPSKQLKFNDKPSVRTLLTSPVGNSKLCSVSHAQTCFSQSNDSLSSFPLLPQFDYHSHFQQFDATTHALYWLIMRFVLS